MVVGKSEEERERERERERDDVMDLDLKNSWEREIRKVVICVLETDGESKSELKTGKILNSEEKNETWSTHGRGINRT